jgi:excisionase family DNA binding protein
MEKLAISVDELCTMLGVGRSKGYQLIRQDGFPIIRLGRRAVIPLEAVKAWLAAQSEVSNDKHI